MVVQAGAAGHANAKQDFVIGAMAPLAKSTNLKHLTEEIVSWSDKPPAAL